MNNTCIEQKRTFWLWGLLAGGNAAPGVRQLEDLRLRYEKDGAVVEVFVSARNLAYLQDMGVGFEFILEGMANIAAKQRPAPPPKAALASPRLGERPFVRSLCIG